MFRKLTSAVCSSGKCVCYQATTTRRRTTVVMAVVTRLKMMTLITLIMMWITALIAGPVINAKRRWL